MIFEISFNRKDKNNNKEFFDFIGAKINSIDEYSYYQIELNSFEELEELMKTINERTANNMFEYFPVISFDPPAIHLDKNV
jgi:hypothetical protein